MDLQDKSLWRYKSKSKSPIWEEKPTDLRCCEAPQRLHFLSLPIDYVVEVVFECPFIELM